MRFKVIKDKANSNYVTEKYKVIIRDAELEQVQKIVKVLEE